MTDSTGQVANSTATAPEGSAAPKPEGKGAPPLLDALLREYEPKPSAPVPQAKTETPPPQGAPPAADPTKLNRALAFFESEENRRAQESLKGDLDKAVKSVKDASPALANVPDRFVRGALKDMADDDPRLRLAWMRRGEDPDGWNKVLQAVAHKIGEEAGSPQTDSIQRGRVAVEAAVRGRQSQAPAPKGMPSNAELSRMNDAQFNRFKKTLPR